jgi:hypothetical protein
LLIKYLQKDLLENVFKNEIFAIFEIIAALICNLGESYGKH